MPQTYLDRPAAGRAHRLAYGSDFKSDPWAFQTRVGSSRFREIPESAVVSEANPGDPPRRAGQAMPSPGSVELNKINRVCAMTHRRMQDHATVLAFRSWLDLGSDQARCEKFSLGNWWAEPVPAFKSRGTGSSKADELSKINRVGTVPHRRMQSHAQVKSERSGPPSTSRQNPITGGWESSSDLKSEKAMSRLKRDMRPAGSHR